MFLVLLDIGGVVRDLVDTADAASYIARGYITAPPQVGFLWQLVGGAWTDTAEAVAWRAARAAEAATEGTKQTARSREARVFAVLCASIEDAGLNWHSLLARLLVDNIQRVPVGSRTARETQFMAAVQAANAAVPP